MRKEDKGAIISQLAEVVKQYGHFYLVDTTAMDAAATSELRRKCFKAETCKYFATMKCDVISPLMENVRFLRETSIAPINIELTLKSKSVCFLSYLTPKWGCSSCY